MTKKLTNWLFIAGAAAAWYFLDKAKKDEIITAVDREILNAQKGYTDPTRGRTRPSDPTAPRIPGANPITSQGATVLTDKTGQVLKIY